MINLKEKLNNIKLQQEQAKELFVKCQGAIEMLNELIKEQDVPKKENKDKK